MCLSPAPRSAGARLAGRLSDLACLVRRRSSSRKCRATSERRSSWEPWHSLTTCGTTPFAVSRTRATRSTASAVFAHRQDVQDTLTCCVCWPTWVHDEIGDEPMHKEACETHVAGNNTFLGVWCDKKRGAPPNTITSTKVVWDILPDASLGPLTHDSHTARERCGTQTRRPASPSHSSKRTE